MEKQFRSIKDFYIPVLKTIEELGGSAHLEDIYTLFLKKFRHTLDESFFNDIKDNDVKWRDYINRAGYQLTKRGYVARGPKRGIWILTGKGIPDNADDFNKM